MRGRQLKNTIYFTALFIFFEVSSFSQCALSGKVSDESHSPIPYAAIGLVNAIDSAVCKGNSTDEKGIYCFNKIKKGSYRIKISLPGFAETYSDKIEFDSSSIVSVPEISLKQSEVKLNEVSVTAIKKSIEFKDGNTTVNIEGSPLAIGNNLYELLQRMPGVIINNDVISIEGNPGVKVFIDDRIQQLSGQQLINLLRSMNASGIEKVEIIKNPPAKYDAAGTAGIINIITKKIRITGFSGNVNYTFSQGFYSTNTPGFSLNYKGAKFALFTSVDAYEGMLRQVDNFKKTITYNSVATTFDQHGLNFDTGKYLTAKIGADWYVNDKNTIGVKMDYLPGYAMRTKPGDNFISDNTLGYSQLSFNRAIPNTWGYRDYNFNAEHRFDTLGTKLLFATDLYSPYKDIYSGTFENRFLDNTGAEVLPSKNFKSDNTILINILSSRLDFEKKFSKSLSLEAGAKSSSTVISSDYVLQNQNNATGIYTIDTTFTNKYTYNELITAGYFTLHKQINKLSASLGLRGENTDIHTDNITGSVKYHPEYFNLFPTLSFDYNKSESHRFQLSFNRRIFRPDYDMFNPYRLFTDILTSSVGNPFILTSYGDNVNLGYVFKGILYNNLRFSKIENGFLGYATQNDSTKETVFRMGNVQNSYFIRYSVFTNIDLKKWWAFTFNGMVMNQAVSGTINGSTINYSTFFGNLYLNNIFLVKKNTKIEFGGFYATPQVIGMHHIQSKLSLNLALKKSFFNDKLNLSVGIYDIFFTNVNKDIVNFQDQHWTIFQSYDSRRLNLSISYNFGKIKAEQREVKASGQEQERMKK